MSILSDLERLITERGSAAITKERLALLQDQFNVLKKEKEDLVKKLDLANSKIVFLEAKNKQLEQKDAKTKADEEDGFDENTETVLKFLFEYGEEVSSDYVAYELQAQESLIEYHFDLLREKGFIRQTRAFMRTADLARGGPAYSLTASGRKFCIQNSLTQLE